MEGFVSLRNRLTRSWSPLLLTLAAAVCLAACGGAPPGSSASVSHTTRQDFGRWVQRYGSALTHVVQDSLVFEGTPSIAACAAIRKSVNAARKVPAPPVDKTQWRTALRDLAIGAYKCEHGIPTVGDAFGHGGNALGAIVRDMAKSHIPLGVTLEGESEAVLNGIAATAAPPPSTTTPSPPTAD